MFEPLADFSSTSAGARNVAIRSAIDRYAAALDERCRADPYNWFNFYDFWRSQGEVSNS
jgi:predicted LPLAT superfamily acyltransferase